MLARWSGWGAVPQVFDEHLDTYAAARTELRELLTKDGFDAASRTVLNAHYTDGALVAVMWQALQHLGLGDGDVLEPGCGAGHFIGMAPPGARMVGVERDPTSAGIAALLYPHARVVAGSFADLDADEGSFDAAVGNVPFGSFRVHDPRHNPARHSIHNHFLIKALHLTRPGGLVVALTSRYTLDARNPAARREMAELADLVGAVRLPTNAHRRAAGTAVVTDLLILRRREPDQPPSDLESWEFAVPHAIPNANKVDGPEANGADGDGAEASGTDTMMSVNQYFVEYPDHVLGEFRAKFVPDRGTDLEVLGDPDAAPALEAALERIIEQAHERGHTLTPPTGPRTTRPAAETDLIDPDAALYAGFLAAKPDGTFTRRVGRDEQPYNPPPAQAEELRGLLGIRDLAMALITAENTTIDDTAEVRDLRAKLNGAYDTYVATYGPPSRYTQTRTMLAGWAVFKRWCTDNPTGIEHKSMPASPDTVRAYLTHLRDAGVGADILTKHLNGIDKAHETAHNKLVEQVLDEIARGHDATARVRAAQVAKDYPDQFLVTTGTADVRLASAAFRAGREVIAAAEKETPDEVDLDELGLRTTTIRRPPQGGFRGDPFAGVVRSLEVFDPASGNARKEDILTQRVINPPRPRLGADTADEALSICLDTHSRVDLDEIARLLGTTDTATARAELGELVFDDPDADLDTGEVVWAPLYLSGNVRRKLARARDAAEVDGRFAVNVTALEQVVPADLGPSDVVVQLGAWVEPAYVQQFLRELVQDQKVRVERPLPSLWVVSGREFTYTATDVWGTGSVDAYELVESLLLGDTIEVFDEYEYTREDGGTGKRRVLNVEATEMARDKAAAIGDRFSAWVFENPERAAALMRRYNDLFNSEIPTDFSTAELSTPGLAASITLREHQIAAVSRMIYQNGVGLIHDVGAGKTLEIIAGVMERRRRGLSTKTVIVVRNDSIGEQFERQWRSAYPGAQVLVATSDDFTVKKGVDKRAEFVARVTTSSWDAIIITKDSFQRVPLSADTQREFIERELEDIRALRKEKDGLSKTAAKKTEQALAAAEERLTDRLKNLTRDSAGVSFEQTGVDLVVVDEAQDFKNGLVVSRLPDLGIPGSDRAVDLDLKLLWLAERYRHSCAVLATATPFTGKFSEIYLWLRRLGHDLTAFDEWARNFIIADSYTEPTPSGQLRPKMRMRRMLNEDDLWAILRLTSDVKMADALNIPGLPQLREGGVEIIAVDAPVEAKIHSLELGRRDRAIRTNPRKPEKGADNHLVINHHGMQAALDLRIRGVSTGEPQKVDVIADDIYTEYLAGADNVYRAADGTEHPVRGGLILAFCDESIPRPGWNFYQELKDQLVNRGMREESIRFIHEATTAQAKQDLFTACRAGGVSVLIGSTARMGAGLNVQDRLLGGYEIIPPRDYRADTSHQARGRVIRQGNQNEIVFWKRVVLAPSLDAKKWEIVRQKHNLFAPLLAAQKPGRHRDVDDDESIDLADVMAAATGDPRYTEKAELDAEYKKLTRLHAGHTRAQQAARLLVTDIEKKLPRWRRELEQAEQVATRHVSTRGAAFSMTVQGEKVTKRIDAAHHLNALLRKEMAATPRTPDGRDITVAALGGFTITAQLRPMKQQGTIHLLFADAGAYTYVTVDHRDLPESFGLITRLENMLDEIPKRPILLRSQIEDAETTLVQARTQIDTQFLHTARLTEVATRRTELTAELSEEDDTTLDAAVDPNSPEGKARAARLEKRAKERAELAEQVRLTVFEAGGDDPHTFADWYVAIVEGIPAGQRPPVLTAHKVWRELGRPGTITRTAGPAGSDTAPDPAGNTGTTGTGSPAVKVAPELAWLAEAAMVSTVATRWPTIEDAVEHLRQVEPLPWYRNRGQAWESDHQTLVEEITTARKTLLSPSGALIAYKAKSPHTGRQAWYVVHTASGAQIGDLITDKTFETVSASRNAARAAITLPDAMMPRYLYALEHRTDTDGQPLDWTQDFAGLRAVLAGWAAPLPVDTVGRFRDADQPPESAGVRILHALAVLDATAPDPLAAALTGELLRITRWVIPTITDSMAHTVGQRSAAPLRRALDEALADRYPSDSGKDKALLAVDEDTSRVLTTTALWGFGADPHQAIDLLTARIDTLHNQHTPQPTLPASRLRELVLHIAELHTPEPTELERLLHATPGSHLVAAPPPDSSTAQPEKTWEITGPSESIEGTHGGPVARVPVTLHLEAGDTGDTGLVHGTITVDPAAPHPVVIAYHRDQPDAANVRVPAALHLPALAAGRWLVVDPDQTLPGAVEEIRHQSHRAAHAYLNQATDQPADQVAIDQAGDSPTAADPMADATGTEPTSPPTASASPEQPSPSATSTPNAAAAPAPIVSGYWSDEPLLENAWGAFEPTAPVAYHEDGPIGIAVHTMALDAQMDIDGEPLANLLGRIATDIVMGRRTAQEGLDTFKTILARLPQTSPAYAALDRAIQDMDAPDTPVPELPDTTLQPLRALVDALHAVPIVRADPNTELIPLLTFLDQVADGDIGGGQLIDAVHNLANRRHERLGDSGKFEIDRAIRTAVTALNELPRTALTPPSSANPVVPPTPAQRQLTDDDHDTTTSPTPPADTIRTIDEPAVDGSVLDESTNDAPIEPVDDGDALDGPTNSADEVDAVGAGEARAVLDTLSTTDTASQWWQLSEELRFAGYRHVRADDVGVGGVDHDERSVRTNAGWPVSDELMALARHVADVRERHNRSAAEEVADTVLAAISSATSSGASDATSSVRPDRLDILRALVAGGGRGRVTQWVADQLQTVAAMRAVARAADEQPAVTILSPHGAALTHDADFSRRANRDEEPLTCGGIQITLMSSPARLEAAIEPAHNSPGAYWVPLPDSTSTESTTIRDQLIDAISSAARVADEHYTIAVREIARQLPIQLSDTPTALREEPDSGRQETPRTEVPTPRPETAVQASSPQTEYGEPDSEQAESIPASDEGHSSITKQPAAVFAAGHLHHHPQLAGTVDSLTDEATGVLQNPILVTSTHDSDVAAHAAWVRTLTDVGPTTWGFVTRSARGLRTTGRLVDGQIVTVGTVLAGTELDALQTAGYRLGPDVPLPVHQLAHDVAAHLADTPGPASADAQSGREGLEGAAAAHDHSQPDLVNSQPAPTEAAPAEASPNEPSRTLAGWEGDAEAREQAPKPVVFQQVVDASPTTTRVSEPNRRSSDEPPPPPTSQPEDHDHRARLTTIDRTTGTESTDQAPADQPSDGELTDTNTSEQPHPVGMADMMTSAVAGPVTDSVDVVTESASAVGAVVDSYGVTSKHPVVAYVRESVARLPHDLNPEWEVADRYRVAAEAIDRYVVTPEGSGVGFLLRSIGGRTGTAESVIPRSLELRPAVEWPHWIRCLRQSTTILHTAGGLEELADRVTRVADLLARRMDALATTPAAFQVQTGAAGVRLLPADHPVAPALARQLDRAQRSQRVTGEQHDTQAPLKLAIQVLDASDESADELAERACYGTPHSLLRWWDTVTELRNLADVAETAGYTTPLQGRGVSAPELWRAVADGVAARLTDRPRHEPQVPVEVPAVVPTQPRALHAGEKTTPVDQLLNKITNGTAHREDAEHTRMAASTATDVAQPMLADLDAADPDRVQRAAAALTRGARDEALLHLSWAVDGRRPVGRRGVREAWDVLYQLLWPEPGWDLERVARRMITWADHDPAQLAGGLVALATAWRTRAETGDTLARLLSEPPVAAIADQLETVAGYLATHWQFTKPTLPRIRAEQASLFDLDQTAETTTEKKPRTRKRPATTTGNTQSTRPDPDDASIAPATSQATQDHTPPVSDTPRTGSDTAPPMLAGEPAPQASQRTRDAAPTIPGTTTAAADTTPDVAGETASGEPTLRGLRAIAAAHDLHVRVVRVADAAFIVVHEPAAPTPPVLSWPVGAPEIFDGAGYPMPAEHAGEYLARYRSLIEPELVAAATGVEDWARRVAYLTPHLLPPLGQQTNEQTWQQVEIRRRLDEALTLAGDDLVQAENRLRGAESLAGSVSLTPERKAQIVREIHDHASSYAWTGDVGRYLTAPGHLDGSWREWDWINTYVRDHPAVLDGHPDHKAIQARTTAELAAQKQAGDDLLREAFTAHREDAFDQALDLLDQADLANPADAARWARARARVHQKQAQTPTPPPALDQSTPHPDTDPAVRAKQTAAPDFPDSTADRQIRTESKQHEPGQPSPDGTDSSPAQPNIGVASAPEVEVSRERGVEVFEAAVAEASQALAETAAAGGHKPLAWLRFSEMTRTDPRTGIDYSATQSEWQVVSQWWVQQATAALGELGYRVDIRANEGRRRYRDHQIEVDYTARLVIVDAALPVGTNAFNLVQQVAALRTEAPDTPVQGQTATLDNTAQTATDTSAHSGHSVTPAPNEEPPDAAGEPANGDGTPPSGSASPTPTDPRPTPATTLEPDPPAEPGVWSQRIQVNLSPTDLTVSGTDRGRDPDSIRATLKNNSFWWQKPVWQYKGRASGRNKAAQAIRDLLSELDAQAHTAAAAPSFPPTPQQQAIKDAVVAGHDVAVFALAGTGKTTTLRMLAHAMPDLSIVYIAFNRSIADEAQGSFPRHVAANTMHSFAKQALQNGPHGALLDKLDKGVRLPKDIAPVLGITAPFRDGVTEFSPEALARLAMSTVAQFRNSAADHIEPAHLPAGIAENKALARMVLDHAQLVWTDLLSPTGRIVFTHDDYLKIWALTKPRFTADVIFFDEAQDINDVQKQVILDHRTARDGHRATQIIVVGDSYQSIYGFRGAKDALRTWPVDVRLPLTQSWRFGPAIADLGNRFLALLKATMQLEGNPALDTRLEPVAQPDAVLCRTNAGAVTAVFDAHEAGQRVALVGGGDAIRDIAKAALQLQGGRRTRHPELSGFADWSEVREAAAEEAAVKHLQPFVRLVDRHGAHALIEMADGLVSETDPNPDTAPQIVVSTAHKAKGREWDAVRIASDFRGPTVDDEGNTVLPGLEELRLSYVTVTRAKKELELGSLNWIVDYPSSQPAPGTPAHASVRTGTTDHAADQAEPELPPAALTTPAATSVSADEPVVDTSPGAAGDRSMDERPAASDVEPALERSRHAGPSGRPAVQSGPSTSPDGIAPDLDLAVSAADTTDGAADGRAAEDMGDGAVATEQPATRDSAEPSVDELYEAEGYPLIPGLTGVSELFRTHYWDLVEVQPVEDVGTYTEHWRRRDVSVAVSITPEDRVLTRLFIRHGPWESNAWHEVETESAQYVHELAEQAGLHGVARPARLPGLWRVEAFAFAADAATARDGNTPAWRLVTRPANSAINDHAVENDESGWMFAEDGATVPLAPPLPQVTVSSREDVIKYVLAAGHGDKDLRRAVLVVLTGRTNKGLYLGDARRQLAAAEPEIYRRAVTAAVGRPQRKGEQFDVARARDALVRLVEGDPALPLNSIGQYVEITEPDTEAERVPLVGPMPTRLVRGVVVEVAPDLGTQLRVVIERDVTSVTGAPRALQDVPIDGVLTWLDPAERPSAEDLRAAREAMVPAIREHEQQLGIHTVVETPAGHDAETISAEPGDQTTSETSHLPVEETGLTADSPPAASDSTSDAPPTGRDSTAPATASGPDSTTDAKASQASESAVSMQQPGTSTTDTDAGTGQAESAVDTDTASEPAEGMAVAALEWWDAGCSVVMVETDGSKRPLPHQWAPFQRERASREQVADWFAGGHPGVGIVTGAVSGGLEMFEFEGRAMDEFFYQKLRARMRDLGHQDLWDRVMEGYDETSPSGGIHVLYRVEGGVDRNTKLAQREAHDGELTADEQRQLRKTGRRARRVLIETRGEGGMVVVAPSHGPVHESGGAWQTITGDPSTIPTITAAERDILHMAARDLDQIPAPPPIPEPAPRATQAAGLRPGDDFNQRASWRQVLEPHGWVPVGGDSTRTFWRRPGKNRGVSAVTGGDRGDFLWVWSTSTALPSEQALSKWRTYGLLDHAGDFSAAARALAAAGYGDRATHPPARQRSSIRGRAQPDRAGTADGQQLGQPTGDTTADQTRPTTPPSTPDQTLRVDRAASPSAQGRGSRVPQVLAAVAPPDSGDADTITRHTGVHKAEDIIWILRSYHHGRQTGWLGVTRLIDNTGSGHHLHIAAESFPQVREAIRRLWPVATAYGLGLDAALDPDTVADAAGTGVIVHLPRLATLDRDTTAVVAALEQFRTRPDRIPGATPIAGAVSHRSTSPTESATPPQHRDSATTAVGTVAPDRADLRASGLPTDDVAFFVAADNFGRTLDLVDLDAMQTATQLLAEQKDRERAMQALWAGIPITAVRFPIPVFEILRDVVYGVTWREHVDPDRLARDAIATGLGLPTATVIAAVAWELDQRRRGDDTVAGILDQTDAAEIVTQLNAIADRMAVHGQFVVPSRPSLLGGQQDLFDLTISDTADPDTLASATADTGAVDTGAGDVGHASPAHERRTASEPSPSTSTLREPSAHDRVEIGGTAGDSMPEGTPPPGPVGHETSATATPAIADTTDPPGGPITGAVSDTDSGVVGDTVNDTVRSVESGDAAGEVVPLPAGEVLVTLARGPAFPGVLAEPGPLVTIDDNPPEGFFPDVRVYFRRSVAKWIGLYFEAKFGGNQIRYEWREAVLAIYDDPWDEDPDEQPRLIYPDNNGRYLIRQPWLALTATQTAAAARHADALAVLAGNDPVQESEPVARYFADGPGRERVYDAVRELIREQSAESGGPASEGVADTTRTDKSAPAVDRLTSAPEHTPLEQQRPEAAPTADTPRLGGVTAPEAAVTAPHRTPRGPVSEPAERDRRTSRQSTPGAHTATLTPTAAAGNDPAAPSSRQVPPSPASQSALSPTVVILRDRLSASRVGWPTQLAEFLVATDPFAAQDLLRKITSTTDHDPHIQVLVAMAWRAHHGQVTDAEARVFADRLIQGDPSTVGHAVGRIIRDPRTRQLRAVHGVRAGIEGRLFLHGTVADSPTALTSPVDPDAWLNPHGQEILPAAEAFPLLQRWNELRALAAAHGYTVHAQPDTALVLQDERRIVIGADSLTELVDRLADITEQIVAIHGPTPTSTAAAASTPAAGALPTFVAPAAPPAGETQPPTPRRSTVAATTSSPKGQPLRRDAIEGITVVPVDDPAAEPLADQLAMRRHTGALLLDEPARLALTYVHRILLGPVEDAESLAQTVINVGFRGEAEQVAARLTTLADKIDAAGFTTPITGGTTALTVHLRAIAHHVRARLTPNGTTPPAPGASARLTDTASTAPVDGRASAGQDNTVEPGTPLTAMPSADGMPHEPAASQPAGTGHDVPNRQDLPLGTAATTRDKDRDALTDPNSGARARQETSRVGVPLGRPATSQEHDNPTPPVDRSAEPPAAIGLPGTVAPARTDSAPGHIPTAADAILWPAVDLDLPRPRHPTDEPPREPGHGQPADRTTAPTGPAPASDLQRDRDDGAVDTVNGVVSVGPGQDSATAQWVRLVDRASHAGYTVVTAYDAPSSVDDAYRVIRIDGNQEPLARVVDLAHKIGLLEATDTAAGATGKAAHDHAPAATPEARPIPRPPDQHQPFTQGPGTNPPGRRRVAAIPATHPAPPLPASMNPVFDALVRELGWQPTTPDSGDSAQRAVAHRPAEPRSEPSPTPVFDQLMHELGWTHHLTPTSNGDTPADQMATNQVTRPPTPTPNGTSTGTSNRTQHGQPDNHRPVAPPARSHAHDEPAMTTGMAPGHRTHLAGGWGLETAGTPAGTPRGRNGR